MCERIPRPRRRAAGRLALILAVSALAVPSRGAAQGQTEEELVRHLHEIMPRLDSARAAAAAARAAYGDLARRSVVASVDSFQVGPLHVLAPSDQRRVAEAFFRDVWSNGYAPFVGTSPALERTTLTFQWSAEPGRIPVDGPSRQVDMLAWRPASAVRATVERTISWVLAEDLPASVADWAGREVRDRRETAADVYANVAIGPSLSNRRCIGGDADACWTSLGLDLDDTPLDEWYSPEERRSMVARFRRPPRLAPEWRACTEEGNIRACDLYLAGFSHGAPYNNRAPLADPAARRVMVWIALTAGGAGAWERLRTGPAAAPGDALRAASGLDAHQLATRWRDWLLTGAPPARARLDPHLLIDLMWIVAFAAFATRSTRWRLR